MHVARRICVCVCVYVCVRNARITICEAVVKHYPSQRYCKSHVDRELYVNTVYTAMRLLVPCVLLVNYKSLGTYLHCCSLCSVPIYCVKLSSLTLLFLNEHNLHIWDISLEVKLKFYLTLSNEALWNEDIRVSWGMTPLFSSFTADGGEWWASRHDCFIHGKIRVPTPVV
jgi:hypothetical protein